ncbi:hypothetical protein [Symbiopectobacterium purcellii]|uniref:Uncharacterized protein n=1 Tax=Symbiopectobacterium purcellii TaxID=2871826 RepID=A0ABX9AMN8_9ENTR|nr:hypothetical protein [Symbiopectobacterium purcellii]QZN96454.1 hypothetical protein K6K13_03040 [Symbiopectobacterium purcellii]
MSGAAKAVGNIVGSILGTGNSSPNVTVATEPEKEMPTEDMDAVKAARRKSVIAQQQRSGRSSTILTGGSNRLGG